MRISRDDLYQQVWAEPMIAVAARHEVSANYLARVCQCLNVPRPSRGYWAKRKAGKSAKRLPLPAARPGDETGWTKGIAPSSYSSRRDAPQVDAGSGEGEPAGAKPPKHRLVKGVAEYYEAARVSDEGYLRPYKKLLPDVYVSKAVLASALDFANQLFLMLDKAGCPVTLGQGYRPDLDQRERGGTYPLWQTWRPARPTLTVVGDISIGLTLYEISEEVEVRYVNGAYVRADAPVPPRGFRPGQGWTTKQNAGSGRLALRAYSPYGATKWQVEWRENKPSELTSKLRAIRRELKTAADSIAKLVEEAKGQAEIDHQRWEVQHREWLRKEREQRRAKALEDAREELLAAVDAWALARRIEEFFADAERRAAGADPEQRASTLLRLERARKLLGGVDALRRFQAWRAPEERDLSLLEEPASDGDQSEE